MQGDLNNLRDEIYADAVAHGLWEEHDKYFSWKEEVLGNCEVIDVNQDRRRDCALTIEKECKELLEADEDVEHFTEELADVIIVSMSVAGKLGIDIDAAVRRKMEINNGRPWKHGKNFSARVNLISGKDINVQTGSGGCITAGSAGSTKKQILPEGGGGKL